MKSIIFGFSQLIAGLVIFSVLGLVLNLQVAGPPWGRLGLGWVAALLLVVVIFLVLLGVLSFATSNVLLICFILVALALLL